jgi:hypothetical protein
MQLVYIAFNREDLICLLLICSFAHLVFTVFSVQVIVLKDPKADYDGGSRGTIKTKGKRGPGFIKT